MAAAAAAYRTYTEQAAADTAAAKTAAAVAEGYAAGTLDTIALSEHQPYILQPSCSAIFPPEPEPEPEPEEALSVQEQLWALQDERRRKTELGDGAARHSLGTAGEGTAGMWAAAAAAAAGKAATAAEAVAGLAAAGASDVEAEGGGMSEWAQAALAGFAVAEAEATTTSGAGVWTGVGAREGEGLSHVRSPRHFSQDDTPAWYYQDDSDSWQGPFRLSELRAWRAMLPMELCVVGGDPKP
jgi:hypothetical protein